MLSKFRIFCGTQLKNNGVQYQNWYTMCTKDWYTYGTQNGIHLVHKKYDIQHS